MIGYVQASSPVAGHVASLAVAHDRAVTLFGTREEALRSQYAVLALETTQAERNTEGTPTLET
jgi:hypothetical protein